MSRHDDGCILLPFVLIYFLLKVSIVVLVYGLAAMMTFATIFWLPLIFIVALFDDRVDIGKCLVMWFALAYEFQQKMFR